MVAQCRQNARREGLQPGLGECWLVAARAGGSKEWAAAVGPAVNGSPKSSSGCATINPRDSRLHGGDSELYSNSVRNSSDNNNSDRSAETDRLAAAAFRNNGRQRCTERIIDPAPPLRSAT